MNHIKCYIILVIVNMLWRRQVISNNVQRNLTNHLGFFGYDQLHIWYTSVKQFIIGLGNGLFPVRCDAIIWADDGDDGHLGISFESI